MYYPQLKVLNMAEIAVHTQHNLLPLRGAQVRDALGWSRHLNDALHAYGGKAEILIAQHHWPVWGQPRLQHLLAGQRDTYKYLHDQTVRLMNHGYVGSEIAEMLKMPESLARDGANHAFYGHLRHNRRAQDRGIHGRRRRRAAPRPGRLRTRRIPLGGADRLATGLCRPRQPGGAPAGGQCL
jgi:alkyl sulfatase BDS1-like metallo-beta-lactamase superfamily hydrolase